MKTDRSLIIFVRRPELGKVKTRLAATVGNEKALAIYEELLMHTFLIAQNVNADKHVFYHEHIVEDDCWSAEGFTKHMQVNADLGGKMQHAFETVLNMGYKNCIIIGSDCFQLTTQLIEDAFTFLEQNDVVIGPANDGGYYLLGMKKMFSFLFTNKEWSTSSVFDDTINDIEKNNLQLAILPELIDVDTEEDWLASKL